MRLRERFLKLYPHQSENYLDVDEAILCEKIADEFAKEVLRTYINSKSLQFKQSQGYYNLDELIEIIKKEKGL